MNHRLSRCLIDYLHLEFNIFESIFKISVNDIDNCYKSNFFLCGFFYGYNEILNWFFNYDFKFVNNLISKKLKYIWFNTCTIWRSTGLEWLKEKLNYNIDDIFMESLKIDKSTINSKILFHRYYNYTYADQDMMEHTNYILSCYSNSNYKEKIALSYSNLDSFLKICETGNLKMVFWILKESKILISKLKKYCSLSPNYDDINHFMYICFEKFVFSKSSTLEDKKEFYDTFKFYIYKEFIKIRSNQQLNNQRRKYGFFIFLHSCKCYNLELFEWLFDIIPLRLNDINDTLNNTTDLSVIKWLYNKYNYIDLPYKFYRMVICKYEYFNFEEINTIEYLFNIGKEKILSSKYFKINNKSNLFRNILLERSSSDKLIMLKWIYNKMELKDLSVNNHYYFRMAIRKSEFEITKWIYSIYSSIDISIFNNECVRMACKKNNIELVKWLHSLNNDNFSVRDCNDYCFRVAAKNNNKNLVKFLYSVDPTINVSVNNNEVFINMCQAGFIDEAKWLLEINPNLNVRDQNDKAFLLSCRCNQLETALWLKCMYPDFYYLSIEYNDDDTIQTENVGSYYIIDKLSNPIDIKDEVYLPEDDIVDECPICLEEGDYLQLLCNHQCCSSCIENLYYRTNNNFKCPLCRYQQDAKEMKKIVPYKIQKKVI